VVSAALGVIAVPVPSPVAAAPFDGPPTTVAEAPAFPAPPVERHSVAVLAATAYRSLVWPNALGTGATATNADRLLAEVAAAVGVELGLPGEVLAAVWSDTSVERQAALLAALSQLGVPYRRMARLPGEGFDCSGLTSYAWGVAGVEIPRSSRDQMRAARRIDPFDAEPGDLVYFPGHVMMSLGLPGAVVHSPRTGRTVEVELRTGSAASRLRYADPLA
jgi:cell wall-associated NlpC family hydrolase